MVSAESSLPDEHFVEAKLAGDDGSFAELTRRHKSRGSGVAARFARGAADLEDIWQDAFIQAGVSNDAMLNTGLDPSAPERPAPHPDLERLHAALA